jgi:predicted GIY-YIG superfamily endonuclease
MNTLFKHAGLIPFYFYVLKLQNGKYYVGSTRYLFKRLKKQLSGNGSNFTKNHLPIISFCVEKHLFEDVTIANDYESQITFEMMQNYGIDNVSGGFFIGSLKAKATLFNRCKIGQFKELV